MADMLALFRTLANLYVALTMTIGALELFRVGLGRLLSGGLFALDPIPFNHLP